jgi:hypothetical protein
MELLSAAELLLDIRRKCGMIKKNGGKENAYRLAH